MICHSIYCDTPMAAYWALVEIGYPPSVLEAMTDEEIMEELDKVQARMNGDY